jgi:hypothetical protein
VTADERFRTEVMAVAVQGDGGGVLELLVAEKPVAISQLSGAPSPSESMALGLSGGD